MEMDKRIREIEERCYRATPGPWERKGSDAYIFSGGMTVAQVRIWGYLDKNNEFIQSLDKLLRRCNSLRRVGQGGIMHERTKDY